MDVGAFFDVFSIARRVRRFIQPNHGRHGGTVRMDNIDAEIIEAKFSEEYNIVNGVTHYTINVHMLFPSIQDQPDEKWDVKKSYSEFDELAKGFQKRADPENNMPQPKAVFPSKNMNSHNMHFTEDKVELIKERQQKLGAWFQEMIQIVKDNDGLATSEKRLAYNIILHFLDAKVHYQDIRKDQKNERLAAARNKKAAAANNANVPVAEATPMAEPDPSAPVKEG